MSFVDIEFFFFFPLAFALYWLLPRRVGMQNGCLLLLSWIFYTTWDWRWLPLLWAGTLVDYFAARLIEANRAEDRRRIRHLSLAVSLAWNLGALAYFKYANFFLESAVELLKLIGLEPSHSTLSILLPLGISFYTLQRISYVVDVYQGRERACVSLLQFAVFSCYFPQLVAGPIARASELLSQLATPRRLTAQFIGAGAAAYLLGYCLKGWIADEIGPAIVDPVFAAPAAYNIAAHWVALTGYAMQIFGDFAGYSLMAIGCSRMFGIELPINFNHPFLSRSLPELWRRWHITLNRWLFDYVYGPLTTSRGWFRGRYDVALLLTFLASGLWHGASLTFVLWGLIHGIGMIVQRRWDELYRGWCRADRRFVAWRKTRRYSAAAWLLTQFIFVVSLVPFRSASFADSWAFAGGLLGFGGEKSLDGWIVTQANIALGVAFIIGYHLTGTQRFGSVWQRFTMLPAPLRGAVYGLLVAYLLVFVPVGAGTFIYQQF